MPPKRVIDDMSPGSSAKTLLAGTVDKPDADRAAIIPPQTIQAPTVPRIAGKPEITPGSSASALIKAGDPLGRRITEELWRQTPQVEGTMRTSESEFAPMKRAKIAKPKLPKSR